MNERKKRIYTVLTVLAGTVLICLVIRGTLETKHQCDYPNCQNEAEFDDGKCYLHTEHRVDDGYLFDGTKWEDSATGAPSDSSDSRKSSDSGSSSGNRSTYGSRSGSGSRGSSNSEMYDYDNADDYADDYAEDYAIDEFGDCDSEEAYEYGYDEAYDDWEDEMEE